MPRALAIAIAAVLAAGCGNERTQPPDVASPAAPQGSRQVFLDAAGLRFDAPANWPDVSPAGSLMGGIRSNRATVAVWRYERTEPLPRNRAQAERVRDLLVRRVEERDATFELERSTVEGRRIELLGRGRIAGAAVEVRSLHLFSRGAEVVIDAYAPPEHFDRVDRAVFAPLMGSVRLR